MIGPEIYHKILPRGFMQSTWVWIIGDGGGGGVVGIICAPMRERLPSDLATSTITIITLRARDAERRLVINFIITT